MADFNQMGGLPTGYADLLNAARQQLVRLPDGTYVQAPQFGSATSVNDVYAGIIPPSVPSPLKTRSVPTYDVDNTGAPIIAQAPGFVAPPMSVTRSEQAGIRPAITAGTQPAGTVAMPPGARPASVDQAFAALGIQPSGGLGRGQPVRSAVADPFGTHTTGGYQDRLPTNAGEAEFLAAFGPEAAPGSAVTAINNAAPVPMPRIRPIPPAMTPLTAVVPPSVPAPRSNAPGSITFKKGDTVGALAKKYSMTVSSFADRYGISNPNRIYAGDTVTTRAPALPRLPPPSVRAPQSRDDRFSSVLDEFGMIR